MDSLSFLCFDELSSTASDHHDDGDDDGWWLAVLARRGCRPSAGGRGVVEAEAAS